MTGFICDLILVGIACYVIRSGNEMKTKVFPLDAFTLKRVYRFTAIVNFVTAVIWMIFGTDFLFKESPRRSNDPTNSNYCQTAPFEYAMAILITRKLSNCLEKVFIKIIRHISLEWSLLGLVAFVVLCQCMTFSFDGVIDRPMIKEKNEGAEHRMRMSFIQHMNETYVAYSSKDEVEIKEVY